MDNLGKNNSKKHLMSNVSKSANFLLSMPATNAGTVFFGLKLVKGAAKLYFVRYSCVVIILFNKGLCKSFTLFKK